MAFTKKEKLIIGGGLVTVVGLMGLMAMRARGENGGDDPLPPLPPTCDYTDPKNYVEYETTSPYRTLWYDHIYGAIYGSGAGSASPYPSINLWNGMLATGHINQCQYDKVIANHWYY